MSDDFSALSDFDGRTRLFPLPNLVLFPYVIQPLHIFEPRYRQMTADALAGDRLLSIILLQPGWEGEYEGQPSLHPIGCLGKIVADQRLDDGRYNLLLRGLRRVRLLHEVPTDRLYRTARVELLQDIGTLEGDAAAALRVQLGEQVPRWVPPDPAVREQFQKLLQSELTPGALCDVFGFALPLDPALKQQLLEELDVAERARRLVEMLREQEPVAAPGPEAAPNRKFPPDFSDN
jgi:Lon protease-like protein